jgi:hypothetical protein
MNDYFGEPWESGICEDGTRHATPVGKKCLFCEEAIVEGDRGEFIYANPSIPESMAEDIIVWVFTEKPGGDEGYQSIAMNPNHRECMYREVMGGIGHHEDHAHWCGYPLYDPDGGRTRRQSSIEVWERLTGRGYRDP